MIRVLPILVIFSLLVLPVYGISDTKLFNDFTYIDSSGAPVIVGEVINWSKEPIKSVEVRANFIDPSGKILDSGTTFAAIDLIEPGQRAPFMVTGDIEYALSVNSFELNVVNFTKGYSKPSKLEIINTNEFSDGVSAVHISGEIRHTGDKMATMSKVYATFYDENNRVVGFTSTFTESDFISPNAKAKFQLVVNEHVPLISSYTLYADSEQFSSTSYGLWSVRKSMEIDNKIDVMGLTLVDQQGNGIGKLTPNERGWIKCDLKNTLPVEQDFSYIVQIKDKDGFPVELKWINGILEPNMLLSPSISWTADDEDIYFAEIFVWNSMENPTPLSTSMKTIILFVKA